MSNAISLEDLIFPLETSQFVEQHLLPGVPYLSRPRVALLEKLNAVDEMRDLKLLLSRLKSVALFGPGGFRSQVPADVAYDFYRRGDVLYMPQIEKAVPSLWNLFQSVALELGVLPDTIYLEAFAGKNQARSTFHYDHDANFQVLLRGRKRWFLTANQSIENPLKPFQNKDEPLEEFLSKTGVIPRDLSPELTLDAGPGSVVYLPLGYWHEVDSLEETFALNVVLKPPRWIDGLVRALRRKMIADSAIRAQALGLLGEDIQPRLREKAERALRTHIRSLKRALSTITLEDLGMLEHGISVRWTDRCSERHLEYDSEVTVLVCPKHSSKGLELNEAFVPLTRKLMTCRGWVSFEHVMATHPELPADAVAAFLSDLINTGYLDSRP